MVTWEQAQTMGQAVPSAPMLPYQVPGGTPGAAAGTEQELEKSSAEKEQSDNYERVNSGLTAAANLHNYTNLLDLAGHKNYNLFGFHPLGQWAGQGGAAPGYLGGVDIAHQARMNKINAGGEGAERAQEEEDAAGAIDTAQGQVGLDYQRHAHVGRGGGGEATGGAGNESAGMARSNIAQIKAMVGSRATDSLLGLKSKAQQLWTPVFDNIGSAIENDKTGSYTYDSMVQRLQPFLPGMSRDEIKQGLKGHRYPRGLPAAGGAVERNRGGIPNPAASPLPGQGADHGDTEGAQPLPGGEMGRGPPRGNKMRPGYQAGFTGGPEDGGQGSGPTGGGDVTNRSGMEPGQEGIELPPMPKQFNQARAFQYERALQVLKQNPGLADNGEWDKRFAPGFPGTAKQLLKKMEMGQ